MSDYIKAVDEALRACKTTDDKISYMHGAIKAHNAYLKPHQHGELASTKQLQTRYARLITKRKKERGLR